VTEPDPRPEHVPDAVLDELMAAFSKEQTPTEYRFDDPSIDRLLGLDDDDHDDDDDDDHDDDDDELHDDDESGDIVDDEELEVRLIEPAEAARPTIVIEHEEQPDTVFLKEQIDQQPDDSGERSTVVIGDLDDGAAVEAPSSRSGGNMDPRMRARRIATRRAEGRRRLVWAAVASVILLVLVGVVAVVASPIFDVREVRVQGAVYTDPDVLQSVVDSIQGEPVLLVDTEEIEARLEAVPWVESARVRTDFPHVVTIDIRERRPVATFQGGDHQFRVIDVQGRVLDVISGQPIAYTLITGDNPDTARGQFAGGPYASAGQLVLALPPEIRSITRSIGVDSATGTLTMLLAGNGDEGIEVRLGDEKGLDDKLARLLQQVRDGLDGVCAVDVSTIEVGVVRC
jgi:cell division protein FtsQ